MDTSERKKGAAAGGMGRRRRRIFDCLTDSDKLLAENIFSRLPVKSILQCRCVCKSWCSLVTNSKFVSKYLLLNHTKEEKENIFMFVVKGKSPVGFKKFLFKNLSKDKFLSPMSLNLPSTLDNNETSHSIVGSVNGLICVSILKFNYSNVFNLILFNPLIGHFLSLTPPMLPHSPPKHPLYTWCIKGFGFDETTQDYKILLIPSRVDLDRLPSDDFVESPPAFVESPPAFVYSLNSDSWRSLVISPAPICCSRRSVVFVNGCIHWIGYHQQQPRRPPSIWVFDLKSETFHHISLPQCLLYALPLITLMEFGEKDSDSSSLAIVRTTGSYSTDVWLMTNYALGDESPWIKLTTVDSHMVFGFIDNDHLLVRSKFERSRKPSPLSGCLVSHNINEKRNNSLIYPDYSYGPRSTFTRVFKYMPSLALLDKPNNIDATFVHVPPSPDPSTTDDYVDNIAQTPPVEKLQLRRSKRTRKLPA